ncbi:MAG: histidine kinase, partial [Acidobacteriota bacterium]
MSQRRRTMQGALLIWLAASLLEATIVIAQEGVLPLFAFLGSAVNYGILGLLAIPAWHLCAWLSQAPRPKWQLGAFYTLLLTVMLTLWQISYQAFFRWRLGPGVSSPIEAAGLWFLFGAAITCGLVIAGIVLAQTSRALRHQAERSAQLKLLAQEAELRSLEAQLRPHFFFNVLNSIYSLIETRPEEAQRMVDQVAQLMRRTLEAAEEDLVPLEWELDSARTYLAIEEIRLGSR